LSSLAVGLRGSVFGIFAELEFADVEPSFLQSKKKEKRSKHPIENLSEVLSQKSEKSCSG
jgi:hypothetical protein